MEDPFKPQSLSIGELFGNVDALYKIPQYQRPYKWEDEQVDKLWEDVYDAFKNNEDNYFLGSIITAKPRDNEKSAYVDVVDGQQRLTTLMILFCVIRDLFPEINKANSLENPFAVDLDKLAASISLLGKVDRLKLYTHSQHQTDFQNIIISGNTSELKKPYKYQIRTDEEPKYKFINTAVIFRNKLADLGQKQSEELINYLFNQVKIIRIDCKNREFAIKLFQVLNDRGMDLTAADLIKSFLLEKLYSKHKEDSDTSKIKEEQFIADWREMEQTIKNCDINLNDLFIIYEYHFLGQNPKKSLYDELQDAFQSLDPNEVIADIKKFASTYYQSIYLSKNPVIYSFRYIPWNMYWKSILLTALQTNYQDFDTLTKELRRFYYLYWIAGKTLSQVKQTSFNLIKWIKDNKPIHEIRKELNDKLFKDKIVSMALHSLTSEQITSEAWCKPILLMIEYSVDDASKKSVFIELTNDLHLEHILPVKYHKFTEWAHITRDIAAKWLNSAGNITLLSGAKNIEASNNPFKVKIDVYKGKGKYDTKDEKITAFEITKQIVNDYNTKRYNQQWNLESMTDRWKWFFDNLGELLDIDVKDTVNKHDPNVV